jgi:hypothetical protein
VNLGDIAPSDLEAMLDLERRRDEALERDPEVAELLPAYVLAADEYEAARIRFERASYLYRTASARVLRNVV